MTEPPLAGEINAVAFDAVGTLLFPDPPAVEVYALVGRKHGIDVPPAEIARRFHDAFGHEEAVDRTAGWAVDEERERRRWRNIVGAVFHKAGPDAAEPIFRELFDHFARPRAWRIADSAREVLQTLTQRGYVLGIASNFDRRLHAILDGSPDLAPLRFRVVSSEIGWRKPDPRFFAAVVLAAGCEPRRILHVGDSKENDYDAAIAAGLRAVLVDSRTQSASGLQTIQNLRELL